MNEKRLRFRKGWSTYMPVLIKAVQETDGSVLELGSGFYSTPLLHWLLFGRNRKLFTYEDAEQYYSFSKRFRSKFHSIRFVDNWDDIKIEKKWSVVLIDHTTNRRKIDAIRVKDYADYVILHDSEHPKIYGYNEVYKHFKYIYHWKFCKPYTTVVSNFKDVNKLI